MFSLAQLRVWQTLEEHPLWTENLRRLNGPDRSHRGEAWDVHMLIVGFGAVGTQFLRQCINLGVMGSSSSMLFDIVDCNGAEKRDRFQAGLSSQYAAVTPEGFRIAGDDGDGTLEVRFHNLRAGGMQFAQLLEQITQQSPLTYAALCIRDVRTSVDCMRELQRYLNLHEAEFPVVARLEGSAFMGQYVGNSQSAFKNVFPLAEETQALSLSSLFNCRHDEASKAFHAVYQSFLPSGGSSDWSALEAFRKESSRAMERHHAAKRMLLTCGKPGYSPSELREELNDAFGDAWRQDLPSAGTGDQLAAHINSHPLLKELAMLEHRRWCYFMALDGWRRAAAPRTAENKARQQSTRENYCLTCWANLCEEQPSMCVYDLIPCLPFAQAEADSVDSIPHTPPEGATLS